MPPTADSARRLVLVLWACGPDRPGGATLAATWAAFDEDGREFWSGMDALVDMLDGLTPSEETDA